MGREMARESVGHGTPRLDYKNYVQLLGAAKLKSHQINKSATTIDLRMCKLDEILPIYIYIYKYLFQSRYKWMPNRIYESQKRDSETPGKRAGAHRETKVGFSVYLQAQLLLNCDFAHQHAHTSLWGPRVPETRVLSSEFRVLCIQWLSQSWNNNKRALIAQFSVE